MGFLTSPVTGAAVTGLTSPTVTYSNDTSPPGSPAISYYVSALGGTQTGVRTHSLSSPFSAQVYRPAIAKLLGAPNPSTGRIANIPSNTFGITWKKGFSVLADQPYVAGYGRISVSIPAGAESYDAINVAGLISAMGGALYNNATSLYNLCLTNAMVQ